MYTEFMIECRIKPDAPDTFKAALHELVNVRDFEVWGEKQPECFAGESTRCADAKRFFDDSRYGFIGNPETILFGEPQTAWQYAANRLRVGTDLKNYGSTIEAFWAWISPWIDDAPGSMIGKCESESSDLPSDVVVGEPIKCGEYDFSHPW